MQDAAIGTRRVLLGAFASALACTLFLVWYVTLGPGRWTSQEPSAMEAVAATRAVTRSGAPAAVTTVVAPKAVQATPTRAPARTGSSAGETAPATEAEALAALEAAAQRAEASVQARGQWVARLASKYVGIVDPAQATASGSHTFTAVDIYAEHALLAASIDGNVYLLDSRQWGTHRAHEGRPYWMTVAVSDAFTDADAVLAWCARQYPTLSGTTLSNRCLPMQLTAG